MACVEEGWSEQLGLMLVLTTTESDACVLLPAGYGLLTLCQSCFLQSSGAQEGKKQGAK